MNINTLSKKELVSIVESLRSVVDVNTFDMIIEKVEKEHYSTKLLKDSNKKKAKNIFDDLLDKVMNRKAIYNDEYSYDDLRLVYEQYFNGKIPDNKKELMSAIIEQMYRLQRIGNSFE